MSSLKDTFMSEKEVEEAKQKRQEEWERVRKPEDPIAAEELELKDTRPLFERLKEQRDKKQLEFEETHRLKNMFRGLDDEEVGFLDYVDKIRVQEERERRKEEKELLEEYKIPQAEADRLVSGVPTSTRRASDVEGSSQDKPKTSKQAQLLSGAVKRKSADAISAGAKKQKVDDSNNTSVRETEEKAVHNGSNLSNKSDGRVISAMQQVAVIPSAMKLAGHRIGLCEYNSSSDSSDNEDYSCTTAPVAAATIQATSKTGGTCKDKHLCRETC